MRVFLLAILLGLAGCASMQDVHQESITVNATYDQAWQAAVYALSETGFSIENSDKDSGLLYAEGGRNLFTQNEAPQLNVFVNEGPNNGQVTIRTKAIQAGQVYDWGAGEGNSKKFFDALESQIN